MSDDEVNFLTQGDSEKEDVVLSLWHDNLKLLVVTDGEKGCRYYTKVRSYPKPTSSHIFHNYIHLQITTIYIYI